MLISRRLKRSTYTSLIIFSLVALLLSWKYYQLNDARGDLLAVDDIKVNFFERATLRDQYFLNREQRIQLQWDLNKKESDGLLRYALKRFNDQISLELLDELRITIDDTADIFHRLVLNTEKLNDITDTHDIYHELDKRLYTQLLLKAASVRKAITALDKRELQRVEDLSSQLLFLSMFSTLAILFIGFQNTIKINTLIRKRLKPLNEGAAIITAGDMSFRINIEGADELSLLGQTINHMTEAIQTKINEEQKSAELLRIAAAVFETNDGILITDVSSNILRANTAFQKMSGYTEAEIIDKNPRILNSGRESNEFYDDMWQQLLSKGSWSGEIWDKRKDGTIYPKWLTITAIKNDAGETTQYVGIFSNIADRQQVELEINRLVFYDVLTGLPNRRLLMDRMRLAFSTSVRSKQYGAVLFLDMDKFKLLNDTLGHDYGDLMLIEVARRIEMCVREIDTVSRIGGDEFVVLLEEMGEHDENASRLAAMIAEKIRAALAQPYHLKDNEHHSSPSIGVCLYLSNDESPDTVLKHADMAMYQVKESGRNAVKFYDPKMQLAVEERATLETDLRKGLDEQQFELFYQIQVDGERNPVGAEALLRWNHPTRGTVLPQDFISIAEESSLIIDIGGWALDSVCHQLAVWSKDIRTQNLVLSVNVSARQLKQLNFVATITNLIHLHGIDPSHLKLELTESLVFGDITNMITKMHELMAIGVKLSMDDFGKGYSSLTYLKQLSLDQLKIDQSFVHNMDTDSNDALMVKTIIDLAKNFHLNVIAEGVETEAQLSLLKELGCLNYQGYLLGKPMSAQQFEALLQ